MLEVAAHYEFFLDMYNVEVEPLFHRSVLCRYPGGPLFNPLGFANDPTKPQPLRWKEIKNGK